jgi:peptidyl-prolyl cis-trans isomerase B (cyclophilin B)
VSEPGGKNLPCPTLTLDPSKTYTVTLNTSMGAIGIRLVPRVSPQTDASFVSLARSGFYNGLKFHRVAAGFVIQGGDPAGDGSGGPGYQVVEPPPSNLSYTPGVVAMAKTATDPSGASGSQFFIVIGSSSPLPPDYAYVGNVSSGMSVAQRIGMVQTNPPGDGVPLQPILIRRATVTER